MIICKHCIEAIRSRGELVVIDDVFDDDDELDCEWCGDTNVEAASVHFPTTESILDLIY